MNNQNYEELYTIKEGLLIAVSGPSGAGKSTICEKYTEKNKDKTFLSLSETTRAPRGDDKDGVDYHFVDKELFLQRIKEDYYLEWAKGHSDEYYGTPKAPVYENLKKGKNVILEIDYQGAEKVEKVVPELIKIFVLPSSFETLKKQIEGRKTESEEKIKERLNTALKEIAQVPTYDYVIINRSNKLKDAVKDLAHIIKAEELNVEIILDQNKGENNG